MRIHFAIGCADGKRVAVTVPSGAVIKIVSGPTSGDDRMVHALWDGKVVMMFTIDVIERGTEVSATRAATPSFGASSAA